MSDQPIHIVGAGLAGSEAAWQAAEAGARVVLHEMRPQKMTEAHVTGGFAELVCSNSFRSDDHEHNAVGLLHEELRRCGSLVMRMADAHKLPAGGALAVDRVGFSDAVTAAIRSHPNISVEFGEIAGLPPADWTNVIIATGPLTSRPLAEAIQSLTGEAELAFFDAIAPIVHGESIDMDIAWKQSRYDKLGPGGTGQDYLNCPLDQAQYNRFVDALLAGEKHVYHQWENVPYFDGCLPVEVMAERGRETLRYGPLKPVGLTNPRNPTVKPYAIVQLRQDNALGTLWNMVGFQTKLKYRGQAEIFRLIPGLCRAGVLALALHVAAHAQGGGPVGLHGDGVEAMLGDQPLRDPGAQPVELGAAMGGFAQQHGVGIAHHGDGRVELVVAVEHMGFAPDGAQGVVGVSHARRRASAMPPPVRGEARRLPGGRSLTHCGFRCLTGTGPCPPRPWSSKPLRAGGANLVVGAFSLRQSCAS